MKQFDNEESRNIFEELSGKYKQNLEEISNLKEKMDSLEEENIPVELLNSLIDRINNIIMTIEEFGDKIPNSGIVRLLEDVISPFKNTLTNLNIDGTIYDEDEDESYEIVEEYDDPILLDENKILNNNNIETVELNSLLNKLNNSDEEYNLDEDLYDDFDEKIEYDSNGLEIDKN